jgi:hypothetical protein
LGRDPSYEHRGCLKLLTKRSPRRVTLHVTNGEARNLLKLSCS